MICTVCEDESRTVEPGWLVCSRDYWRLHRALSAIPDLCVELASLGYVQRDERSGTRSAAVRDDQGRVKEIIREPGWMAGGRASDWPADPVAHSLPAGPVNGRGHQPRVSGAREAPVPIRIDPTDLLAPARPASLAVKLRGDWWLKPGGDEDQVGSLAVATELEAIARDWADERNEGRPTPQVPILCSWLLDRIDWACQRSVTIAEAAATVGRIYRVLMAACGRWDAPPKVITVACPACHNVTLFQEFPEADIECGWPDCRRVLTPDDYREYLRGLYEAEMESRRTA